MVNVERAIYSVTKHTVAARDAWACLKNKNTITDATTQLINIIMLKKISVYMNFKRKYELVIDN